MPHDLEAGYAGQTRQVLLLGDILMNFGGEMRLVNDCVLRTKFVFPPLPFPHSFVQVAVIRTLGELL